MAIEHELRVVVLLLLVWIMEMTCGWINMSPIIGQIAAGLILGPALLDLVPHVEAFKLLGKLGVMVMVVESGLAVNFHDVRRFGPRASLAAATGVVTPTLLSFALYSGVLGVGWKAALAVGAALSPTSLGFSAQLLGEMGQLTTRIGQMICTAAVIDDVLSLLLLAEVQALGDDNAQWYDYAVPVLASAGSVVVGGSAAVLISSKTEQIGAWLSFLNRNHKNDDSNGNGVAPSSIPHQTGATLATREQQHHQQRVLAGRQISRIAEKIPAATVAEQADAEVVRTVPLEVSSAAAAVTAAATAHQQGDGQGSSPGRVGRGDRVLLAMVLAVSLLFAYLSSLVGSSDLLGCFLGGLAFSGMPDVQRVWERQMKRFSQWGARLFFSATVAFSVPSIYKDGGLLRLQPLWRGLLLTAAAVVGKLVVGFYAGPPLTLSGFLKLGWAMNGRGEFSFFIAQEASEEGILTTGDYSAVVWALLLSSVAAPLLFRRVLAKDQDLDQLQETRRGRDREHEDGVTR